jgi:hypothetical protein
MQNRVPHVSGKFPRSKLIRNMYMAFQITYMYDYITKLCRQRAIVVQNHENALVFNSGQGEAQYRKYKRHKLGGGQAYDR